MKFHDIVDNELNSDFTFKKADKYNKLVDIENENPELDWANKTIMNYHIGKEISKEDYDRAVKIFNNFSKESSNYSEYCDYMKKNNELKDLQDFDYCMSLLKTLPAVYGFGYDEVSDEDIDLNIFNNEEDKMKFLAIKNYFDKYIEDLIDENVIRKLNNVILQGNTGAGKTFLLRYFATKLKENRICHAFIKLSSLIPIFKKYQNNNKGDEENISQIVNIIYKIPILIIDDLATENNYASASEILYNIYENNKNVSVIISTNLDNKNMYEQYSGRVLNRFLETGSILNLQISDLRLEKRKKLC